jgi:signal transduction histidine kinase/streptogramin lyase
MRKLQAIIVVCAVLATLAQPAAIAESKTDLRDFAIRTWSKSDGLPDAPVTVIVQTRDGYMWIGTGAGLFRFDGLDFAEIALPITETNAAVYITSLREDNSGNLWIGTRSQGIYGWQSGRTKHFGPSEGLLDAGVTSLALDNEGHLWIGTKRGVDRLDGDHFTAFTTAEGLQDNSVLNVYAAPSGTVWITTAEGTCQFTNGRLAQFHFPTGDQEGDQEFLQVYEDRGGNLWAFCSTYLINLADKKRINHFPGEKSAATRIWNLCEGRGGRLWIGASGRGVFCFDGTKFQPVTLNEGRWPNDVQTIYEDKEGNVWLGIAEVGLVQLRPESFTLLTENRGLPPGPTTCLMSDASGRVCVGMETGGVYGGTGDHFDPIDAEDPFLGQELVSSLCASPDGGIWIGTAGTGLYHIKNGKAAVYTTANGLADDSVASLCSGGDDSVWVGAQFGVIQRIRGDTISTFTQAGGLLDAAVTVTLATPKGGLWLGTDTGTLIDAQNDFKDITKMELSPRLAGKAILGLCRSTNGGLWIGTDGGGLGYVNGELRRAWDAKDGLPDNVVWDMAEDDGGNLWLATPHGLCRIHSDSIKGALFHYAPLKVKLVYETDQAAIRVLRFCGPRALRAAGGRLWFALNSGLVGVDIRGHESEKPPPEVHVESVLVNNKPISFAESASLPNPLDLQFRPQTLEFRYAGLSFDAPEKVRYRHKLDGIDAQWVPNGVERQISYGPLPYGHYVFHVTACNAEGVWNETGASVAFVIPPPLWRNPWVLGVGGVAVAALGVGIVRLVSHRRLRWRLRNLEQQRAMERERMRIAQNMHDEIGSKLTKISYLSERAKAELRSDGKAEGKIDSIATTSHELLKTLDEIVWAVNPHNDSLEHLAAYLCQYAREYFEHTSVECDLRVQSKLPDVEMSAEVRHNLFLAFEESLNNVLKHSKAARVNADIGTEGDYLRIVIRDNGCGFAVNAKPSGKATGGNGLRNIRERMVSLGGTCEIDSAPGQGTCLRLRVPIQAVKLRKR